MNTKPVRLAIVGSGNIAFTHAAAIRQVPAARLTAVCSRNPGKSTVIAAPAGAKVFQSLDELLATDAADALLIATPSGTHLDSALPALRAGRHVLCEKPLEVRVDRIRNMIAEAKRQNVLLAGFFPMRYGSGAAAIRRALDEKRFGRITFLSARVKWWRDAGYYSDSSWRGTWQLDGGGALMNQGIHAVDLLQWFGGEITGVCAYADTLAHDGIEVEDTLAACLRFASGTLGTIATATSCHPGLDLSLEISGDAGTAVLVNDRIDFWRFREERTEDEFIRANETAGLIRSGSSSPLAISCEGHRRQIEEFCHAIRQGDATATIDGREACRAVAIVEAIYRSVKSEKSERVFYL